MFSIVALCSCQGGVSPELSSSITVESFVQRANAENRVSEKDKYGSTWSNLIFERDEKGQIVLYGNYDHHPDDIGDLEAVREGMFENCIFGYLKYVDEEDPAIQGTYERWNIRGEVFVKGDIRFADVNGQDIEIDSIEEGAVFAVKHTYGYNYVLPSNLEVHRIVYIGQIEPLNYI